MTNLIDLCEVTLELKEYVDDPAIYEEEVEYKKSIKTAVTEENELDVLEEQGGVAAVSGSPDTNADCIWEFNKSQKVLVLQG